MTTTVTKHDIVNGLRGLGLSPGDKVLVHSSLKSFGHVAGGADTVIDALLDAVGPAGTVLVPTLSHRGGYGPDNPPEFDPEQTPCVTGTIPETFRRRPGAVRSLHPTHSVTAIGADADALTRGHIHSVTPCDEASPFGRLAQCDDAFILFIGVRLTVNTTFHHCEELAGVDYHLQKQLTRARLMVAGKVLYRHVFLHGRGGVRRDFEVMEPILLERGIQREGRAGKALLKLIHAKGMVETTVRLLRANPRFLLAATPERPD
ncbi:MAG: AAC(3) family N-acetyltransferase [Kiritimatiellae bacterium]|nr:AAC(3) family N-acetyltransferase [Kiritimatiellia bacterium]